MLLLLLLLLVKISEHTHDLLCRAAAHHCASAGRC
jgi:hypothetical protein